MVAPIFFSAVQDLKRQNNCNTNSDVPLPVNYPFSSPGAAIYTDFHATRTLVLQRKVDWQRLIDQYYDVFDTIHPVMPKKDVHSILATSCEDWHNAEILGQFCMVLGLGAMASKEDPKTFTEFFLAAEACLSTTPFMVRPSVGTIRLMCLIFIAKRLANAICWSTDGCWMLLGLLSRQAASLGFHRPEPQGLNEDMDAYQQWKEGQILWTTILHFNIQMATICGLPSFLAPGELFGDSMPNALGQDLAQHGTLADVWHAVVQPSSHTILLALQHINSDTTRLLYSELLNYNTDIARFIAQIDHYALGNTMRIALKLHFRRVQLALHRSFALDPDSPSKNTASYMASLECCLAILVHQRELTECDDPSLCQSDLIIRLFQEDFLAAALTASIHLLQDGVLSVGAANPTRQTIFATLQACTELWAKERHRSICFAATHKGFELIMSILAQSM